MNLLFVGVQASGKGTQAEIISKELGLAHISTGDLLRQVTGELKKEIESYTSKGELIPDVLMLKVLKERLSEEDCKKGFILDGFPRNLEQAKALSSIAKIDIVIEIKISDKTAKERLKGRWNCKKCNIAYNLVTSPRPKRIGFCDVCNSSLYQRDDDKNDDAIDKRIKIYHDETEPILKYYNSIRINGEQTIEKVKEDILKTLK
jgi:adenylate kinase